MSDARLEITSQTEPGLACLQLTGIIDEQFDANRLLQQVAPITVLELSGVRRITSFGVRQWSEVMKALPSSVKHLYLVRCPPVFVDQLSMVLNFGGRSQVVSAYASYACDRCGDESLSLLDFLSDRNQIAAGQLTEVVCKACQTPMQLADDPQLYVRLLNEFGAKTLEPVAASLLDRSGLHAMRRVGRPPEATKLVHDQITLFRLSGTLDARFKYRRLAAGVEGDVVFDLSEIDGLDATGAERWRELLAELKSAISITLVDVPDVLLPAIAAGTFAVGGAGLYSYQAMFVCSACGGVESRPLRADEPLAACTRPCPRCGRNAEPATDIGLVEQVFRHARPAAVAPAIEEVIRNRHEILQRARAESGAASAQSQQQADSISRYRVIKPLTEGGMAEIFLAVHQGIAGFEKLVVLKKILRKMLERRQVAVSLFLNEAKIAANLNHANIVQTFEVGEHGGDLFIAMEYIHGVDARRILRESILKNFTLPIEQVLYVGERVAAALHHAHTAKDLSGRSLNIVHRDVSPSNIILGFDGQVKLLDFGVASAAVGDSFDGLIGKFSYMSPEQIERQSLDGRSDVFALGVLLYEMLARKPLFRRAKDADTIKAVLEAPVPSLSNVPTYVDVVLRKALERRREDRYPDARAFQIALDECIRKVGNPPTNEQIAQSVAHLFPDQSAAPAFDPSMYRSTSSETPSHSLSGKSFSGQGQWQDQVEITGTSPRETADPTVVQNQSQLPPESSLPKRAPVPAPAPTPTPAPDPRMRFGTFPPAPTGPGQPALSDLPDLAGLTGKAHVDDKTTVPAHLRPNKTPFPPNVSPTPPPGFAVLAPMTPPPPTPQPKPLPLPAELQEQPAEALAADLVEAAAAKRARPRGDMWLIALTIVIVLLGLLLVVL